MKILSHRNTCYMCSRGYKKIADTFIVCVCECTTAGRGNWSLLTTPHRRGKWLGRLEWMSFSKSARNVPLNGKRNHCLRTGYIDCVLERRTYTCFDYISNVRVERWNERCQRAGLGFLGLSGQNGHKISNTVCLASCCAVSCVWCHALECLRPMKYV